jgi:hypothetical protein
MKQLIGLSFLLVLFTLSGCEVIGDIFGAGFYTGIFVVVIIVALVIFLIAKMRGRR